MKQKKLLLLFICISAYLLICTSAFAQNKTIIDSLQRAIKSAKNDTEKVNFIYALSSEYRNFNGDSALILSKNALALAEKNNYLKGQARCYNNIGLIYHYSGNYPLALDYQFKAMKIYEKQNDKKGIAISYNSIGIVYWQAGNYILSLENFMNALKIRESYTGKELESKENKQGISGCYINIGSTYLLQEKYVESLANYKIGQKIQEEINDQNGLYMSSNNIGEINYKQGDYPLAFENYSKALKIAEHIGNKSGVAGCYLNIGNTLEKQKKYNEAIIYMNDAIKLARETGYMEVIKEASLGLSAAYKGLNNYEKAFAYFKYFSEIKDTLYNKENAKSIAEMSAKYETENKQKEIDLLNKDKELKDTEIKKRNILIYSVSAGFGLLIILSVIILRSNQQRKKANDLLAEQNAKIDTKNKEITIQKEIIEKKNKDTLSSINYAKRIQETILPADGLIKRHLPQSFVFYRPKDVVSGDFYWFVEQNNILFYAIIDCTGHGVPGALMSMIANSLLNEIVKEKKITKILEELDKGISQQMKKSEESLKSLDDGLDISVCVFDKQKNEIQFAGAHQSAYQISNNELKEFKGNVYSIGGFFPADMKKEWTNNQIKIHPNDMIYMASDGFQDQFSGEGNLKFSSQKMKELFLEISTLEIEKQKEKIVQTFFEWKGNYKQIDDILVIGFRV